MAKIETIGHKVNTGSLAKLSADPNVEGFIVGAFMKDKSIEIGWSDMENEQLAFGKLMIDLEIEHAILQSTGDEDDK